MAWYVCNWSSKGEVSERGTKNVFEVIVADTFLNLMKNINPQFQQAEKNPSRRSMKETP